MSSILNLVWKHLLPGISEGVDLEEDSIELERTIDSLVYDPPVIKNTSPDIYKWSGRRFEADLNEAGITAFSFNFSDELSNFVYWDSEGQQQIQIGHGEWIESNFSLLGHQVKAGVCGTWHNRTTFNMKIRLLGTPFCDTWSFDFINGAVRMNVIRNIWTVPDFSDMALLPDLVGYIK